ncbi:hypothetical protein M0813_12695 [Anaeramoeba flamelloides]|uniref:Uncharacterized protein n=1 Tax=Anaeramoeba flamelloides TaxID=1746091 RepID=A0ABQ8ZB60_9EUKA|nr:hypothetical protein M0813_12695 [Anaeramoeba flamelloides]
MTEKQSTGLVWPRKITLAIKNPLVGVLNQNSQLSKLTSDSTKGIQATLNRVSESQKGINSTQKINKQQNFLLKAPLITKIDENKVFYIGKVTFLDPNSSMLQNYYCILTSKNIKLQPMTGNSEVTIIEYSTLNSSRMLIGDKKECKLLFRRIRKAPAFILSDNLYQIIIIFSILNLVKSNLLESILENGSTSSKEKISQFFFPLIGSIFEKCLNIANNPKTIDLKTFTKTQVSSLKSAMEFLNQPDPLLILKENNLSSQSLFSLILIFQSICWKLTDPFFPKNFQKLLNLFDQELSDEENINNIFQILSTIDSFGEKIIGGIFLIYHLLFKEILDEEIKNNLIFYFINLIHFNIISSELNTDKILFELEKQIPLIKFLIQKAPILLHQEKKEKSRKFVSISNLNNKDQTGYKNDKNVSSNRNMNENTKEDNLHNKIQIKKEIESSQNSTRNNLKVGSEGGGSIKSMDSLDFLINDNHSIGQNDSSTKMEGVASELSKSGENANRNNSKSQINNNNDDKQNTQNSKLVKNDENELHTLLNNRQLFEQSPLPLLPLMESNHKFIQKDHIASKTQSEIIEYLFDEECSGIWKAVETLELLSNSKDNSNDLNLFIQILELLCFEISWIGIDACKIHEKSLELAESIIENDKNKKESFSLLDALLSLPLEMSPPTSSSSSFIEVNKKHLKKKSKNLQKTKFKIFGTLKKHKKIKK